MSSPALSRLQLLSTSWYLRNYITHVIKRCMMASTRIIRATLWERAPRRERNSLHIRIRSWISKRRQIMPGSLEQQLSLAGRCLRRAVAIRERGLSLLCVRVFIRAR